MAGQSLRPEEQLKQLLLLLSEYGSKLSYAHRAQHLQAARALLLTLQPSAFRAIPGFTLRCISNFIASCEAVDKSRISADEEPAIEALLSLVSACCGCVSGDAVRDVADTFTGEEYTAPSSLSEETVGGLFGRIEIPKTVDTIPGAILPSSFASSELSLSFTIASLRDASASVRVACAHIIDFACTAAITQRALRLRTAAIAALAALVRVLHPSLQAAFFPGIASKLMRILTRARLEQSIIATLVLDVISVLVGTVFPLRKPTAASEPSFSALVTALQAEHLEPMDDSGPSVPRKHPARAPDLIQRTDKWFKNASQNFSQVLAIMLESADGPRLHEHPRARAALVKFLSACVYRESTLQINEVVRSECFIAIIEIAADPFDAPKECAAKHIMDGIRECANYASSVETGFTSLVSHVLELSEALSFNCSKRYHEIGEVREEPEAEALRRLLSIIGSESRWTILLKGYLFVLGKKGMVNMLSHVDFDDIALALVAYQKAVFKTAAIDASQDYDLLRTPAVDCCAILGEALLLSNLFGPLVTIAEAQMCRYDRDVDSDAEISLSTDILNHDDPIAFMNHVHAVQCIHALILGTLTAFVREVSVEKRNDSELSWEQLKRCSVGFLQCAAACALPFDDELNAKSGWADVAPTRAKQTVLMNVAQLCDMLSSLRSEDRPLGFEIVLPIILSLLVDVAREDQDIRQSAELALQRLAVSVGCSSGYELIKRHLNFIVSRLVRNLHCQWAGAVLRYVIKSEDDPISARVVALSQDTLIQQCNDLAGASDFRAATTLAAIDSVLSAALHLKHTSSSDLLHSTTSTASNEIKVLTSVLMRYCLEDSEDNIEDTSSEPRDEPHVEKKDAKTPFELVAVSVLRGIADILVGRPAQLRARALGVAAKGIKVLLQNEKALLPEVATLLPLIPAQLEGNGYASKSATTRTKDKESDVRVIAQVNALGRELQTIAAACTLMAGLVRAAKDFVRARFEKLVFPRLRPLLRLIRVGVSPNVSFGALAAADAALECTAAVAMHLPEALKPFSVELTHYVLPYICREKEMKVRAVAVAGNLTRKRYELRRMQRRMEWAQMIIRGAAMAAPDIVWTQLVVEDGPRYIEPTVNSNRLQKLRVYSGRISEL